MGKLGTLDMCRAPRKLKILLVGAHPLLEAEALALDHAAIAFTAADPVRVSAAREVSTDQDVIVINLDNVGGLDLVGKLCAHGGCPVIGLGSRGRDGHSLEHLLLLAELRGAAAVPGPIDAVELALNALEVLRAPGFEQVASELERRVAW